MTILTSDQTPSLHRRDVLRYEQRLCDAIQTIMPFATHAIYFPPSVHSDLATYLPEEDKVLIPLFFHKAFLGVFMARGVDAEALPALLPVLPKLASLALENVLLYKQTHLDASTGLATKHTLLTVLANEIERIRESFAQTFPSSSSQSDDNAETTSITPTKALSGGLGLVIFHFDPLQNLKNDSRSYLTDQYRQALAKVLQEHSPEHALATALDAQNLALLLPGEGRLACIQAIEQILPHLNNVTITAPITSRPLRCRVFAGYAIYPHDLDAIALRTLDACAHTLIHRAILAADMAKINNNVAGMSYARILHEGGIIEELLPLSRVRINLGRAMGVREGQHFAVHDTAGHYKGEILIIEAHEQYAHAEWWQRADIHLNLEQGDTLALLAEPTKPDDTKLAQNNSETLLSYRDMLTHLAVSAPLCERFAIVLIHIPPSKHTAQHDIDAAPQKTIGIAQDEPINSASLYASLRKHLQKLSTLQGLALCRFSNNACMAFVPLDTTLTDADIVAECTKCMKNLEQNVSAIPATGIAVWPFLDLRPADMFEAARQALSYAQLLPYPHIGLYDSLAITIHADSLHCQGDTFGAIEAYKRALLIDEHNALAWNSLGICLSSLSQRTEARRHFEEALRHAPEDASIAYNLGAVCQALKDNDAAKKAFNACLALEPEHPYAHIRLGHLALAEDDFDTAYKAYTHTKQLIPHSALPCRYLAEWALRCPMGSHPETGADKAREHAHAALILNPQDVPSLSLMARLYLDRGEDPALAASLARQCVALRPTYTQGWRILARALSVQGKNQESREAYLRAHALS